VRLHATGTYEVAFCGFSPGFAYLRGIDERLHVPRRDTPRTSVPAGSIGVAAGYTCVYPSASPGGWHLIGRTTAHAVGRRSRSTGTARSRASRALPAGAGMTAEPALRIVQVGFATTVQDGAVAGSLISACRRRRRRPSHARRDEPARREPARCGDDRDDGRAVVEAVRPVVIATSTDASRQTLSRRPRIRVDAPADSVWGYLAVRGGIDVEPVLGSRSHDTLGGVGPPALAVRLAGLRRPRSADAARCRPRPVAPHDRGARADLGRTAARLVHRGHPVLIGRPWRVTNELSRVGVRLEPASSPAPRGLEPQMASIGLTIGAVQITPAGEPIVMLANHPTTGGYPVIGVVDPDDLPDLVQTRPGSSVQFRRA
jgi:hypothetical protein